MRVDITVRATMQWAVNRDSITGHWTAVCEDWHLTARGDDWDDLQKDIKSAVNLVMRDLFIDPETDAPLSGCSWVVDADSN